jgi:hypothetical protein
LGWDQAIRFNPLLAAPLRLPDGRPRASPSPRGAGAPYPRGRGIGAASGRQRNGRLAGGGRGTFRQRCRAGRPPDPLNCSGLFALADEIFMPASSIVSGSKFRVIWTSQYVSSTKLLAHAGQDAGLKRFLRCRQFLFPRLLPSPLRATTGHSRPPETGLIVCAVRDAF